MAFDVYMPQCSYEVFTPFTVNVPANLSTSGWLKDHIIGVVRARSGLDLRQEHACLSDRITLAGRLDRQADLTARQT